MDIYGYTRWNTELPKLLHWLARAQELFHMIMVLITPLLVLLALLYNTQCTPHVIDQYVLSTSYLPIIDHHSDQSSACKIKASSMRTCSHQCACNPRARSRARQRTTRAQAEISLSVQLTSKQCFQHTFIHDQGLLNSILIIQWQSYFCVLSMNSE